MNTNNLIPVDLNTEYKFVTKEQLIMAEHLHTKGFELFIEGPYDCGYHDKQYCYVWAVKEGVKNGLQKLDGCGYNVHIQS